MLSRQCILRSGACCEPAGKVPKPLWPTVVPRRLQTSVLTSNIRTAAYDDDFDGGSRYNRGPRGRQGPDRRQQRGGRSRSYDEGDGDDWGASSESFTESINIDGSEASTAAPAWGGQGQQRSGRGYGRGGGGGGYERRGGYGGGGRGYGRGGGDRRSGDTFGEGSSSGFSGEQGWQGEQGRRYGEGGGRGYQGRGQGGRYGGRGRGGYSAAGDGAGGAEGGEDRRTQRAQREPISPEAQAARLANNDALKAAADWRAVAAVLETRGSSLDAENISFMLYKICREPKPTSPDDAAEFETLVASLYGWVSALASTMRTRQLATALFAMAKLELFNADLVTALASRAAQMMGNFTPWEYSNMMWGFSRMNFTPGDEWLGKFVFWTERRLGEFKSVELSNVISALSRLGYVPPAAWLDAFSAAVGAQAHNFNNLEATNTLFGLASLGYTGGADPGSWLGPLLSSSGNYRAAGGAESSSNGAAGVAGEGRSAPAGPSSTGAVENIRVTDLTRITWALTQFNWQPPASWLDAACKGFIRQLRYCRPSELATISYSLAYLRVTPTPDDLRVLASLLSRSWQNLTGDELANVAMSLALWQYRPSTERWLDELVIACRDKLSTCSADGLTKVVSSLPMLGAGYRLNQVVAQAQGLLDGSVQQQEDHQAQQAGDAAMAAV